MPGSAPAGPYGAHIPGSTVAGLELEELEELEVVICLVAEIFFADTNRKK